MIKNSSGRLDLHILNTHHSRNHKKNKEDRHIFNGKKKMGLKETKSYPERENENEFQNQNSCFDCKKNFSSRLALKQHNNIHLGTKMFHLSC